MEKLPPELKRKLKSIRSHIDSHCDAKAKELITELLEEGVEDYFLYLFAAVVHNREGNIPEAFEYYKKAATVDSNHISAWQGIFKLYENGELKFDDFAVTALDKLISFTSEEKRLPLQKKRADLLMALQKYDVILKDEELLDNEEFCHCAICSIVSHEKKYTEIEKAVCDRCFERLELCDEFEIIYLKLAQYRCALASTVSEIREAVLRYANRGIFPSWDSWAMRQVRFGLGIQYLVSRKLDTELCGTIKSVKGTPFEELYGYLAKKDTVAALNYIDSLPANEYDWPLITLIVPALLRHEHYERALTLLEKPLPFLFDAFASEIEQGIAAARMEAYYYIGDKRSLQQLHKLLEVSPHNSFAKAISLMVLCQKKDTSKQTLEDALEAEPAVEEVDTLYWRAFYARENDDLAEAKTQAEAAVAKDPDSWRKLLLLAEILLALDATDRKATSLLVKAAKINPSCSRIFLRLGEGLMTINRQKAIQCLERAAKIRPQSFEVAKLYDRLLALEGRKEDQLKHICQFLALLPSCDWALRRRAFLKMEVDKIDEAVEDLQRIMRKEPQDIAIWNALGEAYRRRGNLQSSAKAFNAVIEMDPNNYNAHINLVQIYHLTGQLEDAVGRCELLLKSENFSLAEEHFQNCHSLLYASSLLKLAEQSPCSRQFELLSQFCGVIETAMAKNRKFATVFKLAADSLMLAAKFHVKSFAIFPFPHAWSVSTPSDALKLAAHFYCIVVKFCPSWAGSWNDLGVALTKSSKVTGDLPLVAKATFAFKRAIILCEYPQVRSVYWTNLSRAIDLTGNKLHTQHCLVRALQLNRRNDRAWCLLGLFYLQNKKLTLARQAFDMAQKCNPELAEMWCGLALLAEGEKHYDTMDLFRHSLTLRPTELAIRKYSYYAMQKRKEGATSDNATMFGFESLHEHYGVSSRSDELKFYISLIAEQFWCLAEALHFIRGCGGFPSKSVNEIHSQRMRIQSGETALCGECACLKKFADLHSLTTKEIYDKLRELCPNYAKLFDSVDEKDTEKFRHSLLEAEHRISVPAFISAAILFGKELDDDMLSVMDDVRPHHQLIDVFPPQRVRDAENEFSYDIKDQGEKPLIRHDNLSKHLCELLSQKMQFCQARYADERPVKDPFAEEAVVEDEKHEIAIEDELDE